MVGLLTPREIFEQTAEQLREIVWWNQNLTKLSEYADTSNLENMLVETDGPYIEKINPPAYYDIDSPISWNDLADRFEISEEVKIAICKVLFKGESELPLYYHQGEAIKFLCQDTESEKNVVISVPTATGKTEAFMIPLLDYCVKKRKEHERFEKSKPLYDLKGLIIYPMKSLELDQLNRFVEYLHVINIELAKEGHYPIRIGIWDGDTPTGVADVAGSWGEDYDSYGIFVQREDGARGLKCPKHDDTTLQYFEDTRVLCPKGHTLDWVSMTREGIRNGVDILITNPEALSHLLLSPKNKNVIVSDDLKYLVVDEAHTWKGISGSIFSIFLQRLRALYEKSSPFFILSSATIPEPENFSKRLLHTENIRVIGYHRLLDTIDIGKSIEKIDFSRIPISRFDYSMLILLGLDRISRNSNVLSDFLVSQKLVPDEVTVNGSFNMMELLKLIKRTENGYNITEKGKELLLILNLDSEARNGDLDSIIQNAFDSLPFMKRWTEIIIDVDEGLPEIAYLSEVIFGKNNFMKESEVLEKIQKHGKALSERRANEILSTLLSFGRVSRTIFDKYHFFQKPISSLYICLDCNHVWPLPECPIDPTHNNIKKLYFCTKCHTPAILDDSGRLTSLLDLSNDGRCSCGRPLHRNNFREVFLPYSAFTTYLMSVISNKIDPKKILVFGDGRQLVESIASRTQDLDYSLVAQRIICYELLVNGPTTLSELFANTGKLLEDLYIKRTPLKILSEVYSLPANIVENLHSLRSAFIRKIKYDLPTPSNRWFESSVISFVPVQNYSDPLEKAFVHSLLSIMITYQFYSSGRIKVGPEWFHHVKIDQLKNRLEQYPDYSRFFKNNRFNEILSEIVQSRNGLDQTDVIISGNDKKELDYEALVLRRDETDLDFFIPKEVSYCEVCYEGYPTPDLERCPYCLNELNKGARFSFNSKGDIQGDGYLSNIRDSEWILDHWAKDILGYAVNWLKEYPNPTRDWNDLISNKMEYMVVLSHRSGIAQILRSEIEEGFKRKDPIVHAVCATPTMELGIDIGTLNHICQIGIPPTKTNYVQRAGRTGRKMKVPSLIFTILRNENEIDSYFLTDLSRKFLNRDLNPIFIPDPSERMLLNHVFVEILQYLNIHPEETRSQYNNYYQIFPFNVSERNSLASEPVIKIFNYVIHTSFYPLSQDILRNYKSIIEHLDKVFKPFKIDVEEYVNELLYGLDSLLMKNTIEVFEKLEELYDETLNDKVKKEFIERNSVLGMFLGTLNLFTDFRGIGSSVPIYDARDGGIIELKSLSYALRESFPGDYEKNQSKRGALWYIETRRFDILRVIGKETSLIPRDQKYMICTNPECENPFETYPESMENCPWCASTLKEFEVYEYQYGEARHALTGIFGRTSTQPIKKTLILSNGMRSVNP